MLRNLDALGSCVIVGESSLLIQCTRQLLQRHYHIAKIFSPDSHVQQFAQDEGFPYESSNAFLAAFLEDQPVDYLFSIVNHAILGADVLKHVKKLAINYHDAPLPAYAGLNATYWALLHQEKTHGITWHSMATGIDTGNILQQTRIPIAADETTFSLNVKCYEAAIQAFSALLELLPTGHFPSIPQDLNKRSYFSGKKRPSSGGIIDWNQPAGAISSLVRASDFGFHPNPIGLAKLMVNEHLFAIKHLETLSTPSTQNPGTIVAVDETGIRIATQTTDVIITHLTTLSGQDVPVTDIAMAYAIAPGFIFSGLKPTIRTRIEELDTTCARHQKYWSVKLAQWQATTLPFTKRIAVPVPDQSPIIHQPVHLPVGMEAYVADVPEKTMADFVAAVFLTYLARITGSPTIHVGFSDDKLIRETSGLPVFFASTVPLQTNIDLQGDFVSVLAHTEKELAAVRNAKTYPLDVVARFSRLHTNQELHADNPFAIRVAYTANPVDAPVPMARELTLLVANSGMACQLLGNRALLTEGDLARMADQLETLMNSILQASPSVPVRKLSLLSDAERHKMLFEWNDTATSYRQDTCIHQLVEEQVQRTPDALALIFENQHLTYDTLNKRSNRLAHFLRAKGLAPGVLVGVCMEKSVEMIVAVLGILKAGGAYVPLEPNAPKDRLSLMLQDLQVPVILTQERTRAQFAGFSLEAIALDQLSRVLERESTDNPQSGVTSQHLAYIIFTSGSTGIPKGVMVRHQPAINLIEWVNRTCNMGATDRGLFVTSLGFDLSVYDIFGMLAAGGSIRMASSRELREPQTLLDILHNEPITLWNSAPAALSQIVPLTAIGEPKINNQLRLVFLSGDWIPLSVHGWLKSFFPGAQLISLGGATEATVWSNYYVVNELDKQWVSIPYGRPIQNARYHILDANLQPVPVGVAEELYIGGECLADGYFKRPELTSERFIRDPFSNNPNARLYKTGDLARYMPDGNIEFLGRKDFQVKIRGFRVELGEIEAVLAKNATIQDVIVTAQPDASGEKRLVAYVVPAPNVGIAVTELKHFLKDKLPEYMVPSAFVVLKAMPINASGKIDRKALPAPDFSPVTQTDYVAPRNATERMLARIWMTILKVPQVGIYDNFFELGGHSLQAVRLSADMQTTFGKRLPLSLIFSNPSVVKLAVLLEETVSKNIWRSLVPIRPTGSKPPLFCIHPMNGQVEYVTKLARYLDNDQPVYGLQSVGLDGISQPLKSIEAMAEQYLKQIREVQPTGPYQLAGYSCGGLIAYEMACQLQAMGETVHTLILFDTYPTVKRMFRYRQIHIKYIVQNFINLVLAPGMRLSDKWNRIREEITKQKDYVKRTTQFIHKMQAASRSDGEMNLRIMNTNAEAHKKYAVRPYYGEVVFIRVLDNVATYVRKSDFGWHQFARTGVDVYELPGDHFQLFAYESNVAAIAEIVDKYLTKHQEQELVLTA